MIFPNPSIFTVIFSPILSLSPVHTFGLFSVHFLVRLYFTINRTEKNATEGTGGNFSYYELGESIFDGEALNASIGLDDIRKYVYFTETQQKLEPLHTEEPCYMGTHMDVAYYFNYEKGNTTTLNRDFLHTIQTKADEYVIYADLCTLSQRELEKWHISFKKIPRDIKKM